ncbi:hypothetical protein P9112_012428 [Eukaryota sp. TZLM1-RC]
MQSWTRACSLHQFFEWPVCDYIDGQLTKVTTMTHLGSLLARVFAVINSGSLFHFLVGDPQRYNTLRSSRRVTLNQENSTYIFRCGSAIQNHLEQAFPHTLRRHRLTPIASLKPAFVLFSTWVLNHFISKNTSQTILENPYLLFKTNANDYTMSSNGDSVRITFKPHPKATRVRLSGEALTDKRSRGELDYYETTRNRKHTLQAKVERSRPRQKPKATEWQVPDDEMEMVFWAINHSNLCGSSIGKRSGPTVSNIFLAPKQRKINHSASLDPLINRCL